MIFAILKSTVKIVRRKQDNRRMAHLKPRKHVNGKETKNPLLISTTDLKYINFQWVKPILC